MNNIIAQIYERIDEMYHHDTQTGEHEHARPAEYFLWVVEELEQNSLDFSHWRKSTQKLINEIEKD